ncbi:MAG: right-handed parallel beta-helix repeat-containing protein [Planctomycetota bacterium]|jgi:parallel beta-helix repeat protein
MKTAILLAAFLFIPNFAFSATIHVPGDYPTIQEAIDASVHGDTVLVAEAIDASVHGDTVLVAAGTYVENIDFKGKGITVQSSMGAGATIIDGGNPVDPDLGSAVSFKNGEGLDAMLVGFTVIHGTGTFFEDAEGVFDYHGGGIFCKGASPTLVDNMIVENSADKGGGIACLENACPFISNNLISGNTASVDGGGIFSVSSTPLVTHNTFSENTATYGCGIYLWNGVSPIISANLILDNSGSGWTVYGGGIFISGSASALIDKNVVIRNDLDAEYMARGAGIYCMLCTDCVISDNIVKENTAALCGAWGGGIFCALSDNLLISNNLITGNVATSPFFSGGGGLNLERGDSLRLVNNTITNNRCYSGSFLGGGGGLSCESASLTIENSIFWNNESHEGPEISLDDNTRLLIDNSDVKGGADLVYIGYQSSLEWGANNLDSDPLFVDSAGNDFHLTYSSPCRDTGNNGAVLEFFDFEGDPRIAYGFVDMGADEFYTHLYCTGDFTPSGAIEGKLVGLPGTSPVGLFLGSGVLDPPLPTPWGSFHLQAPWLLIHLVPIPANGVLTLPATIPASPSAPYDLPMQALVGLNPDSLTNLFVLEVR